MHDRSYNKVVQKNSYYSTDIQYALQMCQWVLKPLGVWPLICKSATRLDHLIFIPLLTVCYAGLLFVMIPSSRFLFFGGSISKKMKPLGSFIFFVTSTIKYIYFGVRGTVVARCIEHMERDWKTVDDSNHRSIMLKCSSFSRSLITTSAAFLLTGGISFHTIMPFLSKNKGHGNVTIRPMTYPGCDAFFDVQASPTYEIVFSIQVFAALIKYAITIGAYSLVATFVTHISGQIQIQISRLENLINEKREKNNRNPLGFIVYNHVEILKFSINVQEALEEVCFMEIVQCTICMCILQYYFIVAWRAKDMVQIITFLVLLISFIFNIFIFCYIGEILTEQCGLIGIASYEIEWYHLPAKKAHDLILLNAVSQNPPKLMAGRIFELSMNTFSLVLKTSVAYMNMLRQVTE